MSKHIIKEIIVVEGRDDTAALNRAVSCTTIETHGFGLSEDMWNKIDYAYKTKGIIIFTDPDSAGNRIRRKILERYPDANQAFLSREKANKKGNIGIENAAPEHIVEALLKAHATIDKKGDLNIYTMDDLISNGLSGNSNSKQLREEIGDRLGIGYCNAKGLLKRLNSFSVDREEFEEAVRAIERE